MNPYAYGFIGVRYGIRDVDVALGSIPDARQIKLLAWDGLNIVLAAHQAARVREAG